MSAPDPARAPALTAPATFAADVLTGLASRPKQLPCKWLYDRRGSELFEQICELDEYYPTRTELSILRAALPAIAERLGPRVLVLEPGSGSGEKTRLLLAALEDPIGWAPIDISPAALHGAVAAMRRRYPGLELLPVHGDFAQRITVPATKREPVRRLLFFPGSTIGNFAPAAAQKLLARFARVADSLLIGVDLRKDPEILLRAYDDAQGVTAEFDRNLLARINRELDADFDLARFAHRARWNDAEGRIEMHLESLAEQYVHVLGRRFGFHRGETIHTENSYKWRLEDFEALAAAAGWRRDGVWTDPEQWFAVLLLGR